MSARSRPLVAAAVVLVVAGGCTATDSPAPVPAPAPTGPAGPARSEVAPAPVSRWPATPGRTLRPATVRGIDVSHHQGDVDWAAVAASGVSFAYLKATEGSSYVDPTFTRRWGDAHAAGLRVGAYHYVTLCSPAPPQAEHFLSVLDSVPAHADDLPPVIDLELIGNCDPPPPRDTLLASVRDLAARIRAGTGRRVVLYPHPDLEARYRLVDDVVGDRGRELWVRRVDGTRPEGAWWMWQRDDDGVVPGIDGPVDLDVLSGR